MREKLFVSCQFLLYNFIEVGYMKKKICLLMALCMMLFPLQVFAATTTEEGYIVENLEEVLTRKKIDHDLKDYEENDKQVPVYLFYGINCGYCERFINFMNSIVEEYGEYFKLVAFEVSEKKNSDLMSKAAKQLNKDGRGVPLIVIGDKAWEGYASDYDDEIKSAIKKLYDKDDRYDLLEEIKNPTKKNDMVVIIVISLVVVGGIAGLVFIARKND